MREEWNMRFGTTATC